MVRMKPSLCFDLIGDQFDSAEMLPHADYQNSAIPPSFAYREMSSEKT